MGLFWGRERRYNGYTASFSNPPIPPNSSLGGVGDFASLDLSRAESSLQKVALWSAVDLIASLVEMAPVDVYTGKGAERRELSMPTWMEDPAGDGQGLPDWVSQWCRSHLLRGNVYGRIAERDGRLGYPTQIVLYHPDDVRPVRDADGLVGWRAGGATVPRGEMWHRRTHPVPGCLLGLSPVGMHLTTIGQGLAAGRFGHQFFLDGAHPTSLLINEETGLDKGQADTAKSRFLSAMRGRREPLVLGKGWKYQAISLAPEESQFLETQKYTAAECARIFGPGIAEALGYETGGSMEYSNVEQRAVDLLKFTVDRWFTRLERDLTAMLPRPRYVKLNRASVLRTDVLTRYRAHALAISSRFLAPSEARALEDLPPLTAEQAAELAALPTNMPQPKEGNP